MYYSLKNFVIFENISSKPENYFKIFGCRAKYFKNILFLWRSVGQSLVFQTFSFPSLNASITKYFIFYVNLEDEKCFKYYNPPCILIIIVNPSPGRQGNDIGDVKFNSDGDGLGRYSVYQYQHTVAGGWEYNWIGEFGEKDNFRWDKVNKTGEVQI